MECGYIMMVISFRFLQCLNEGFLIILHQTFTGSVYKLKNFAKIVKTVNIFKQFEDIFKENNLILSQKTHSEHWNIYYNIIIIW